eukprot:TRINITY_DN1263_c0_g1_i1.p1 TRINITY_DN1263_c0_g1~~TRINITY_DN1263_c0_g1_i1.p1  ORF type:complete len:620 (+),score=145.11 TRINITY_DN1263_c0_g1_i1:63-1922(+)
METPAKRTNTKDAQNFMSPIPEDKEKSSKNKSSHCGHHGTGTGNCSVCSGSVNGDGGNGTSYAGPYRLMESLGKGGLATVKVGVDLSTGHRVAVKIVDKSKLANPREQISMAREITIMKLLKHPNILHLYDVYENTEKIFLILDLYEGGDLYGHLIRHGPMRPSEVLGLFRQLIKGIEFCHNNLIVHRDLKPENLLLSKDKKTLVISDFGLSTGMAGSRNLLKTRCGTVHYISPEVAKGEMYVGMASDVWSCGIILYAMSTASLPFDGETSIIVLKKIVKGEYTIPHHLPPDLKDLIRKMLTPDPAARITVSQIKQHPWHRLGATREDLMDSTPVVPNVEVTAEMIQQNESIFQSLKLLGWEEAELKQELLSPAKNQAKVFFSLLVEQKAATMKKKSPAKSPRSTLTSSSHGPDPLRRPRASSSDHQHTHSTSHSRTKSKSTDQSTTESEDNKENISKDDNPLKKAKRPSLVASRTNKSSGEHPEAPRTRQRAATIGSGGEGPVKGHARSGSWDVSPVLDPEAKIYSVESKKSLNQILESLKTCFMTLDLEFTEKKHKRDSVKVKGKLPTGKAKKTQVVVEVKLSETGSNVVNFKRSKKSSKKEDFKEVCKKIEENLIV